jgi:hypothetical protein
MPPDAAAVTGVLPLPGDGQVLITTQDPRWATQVAEVPVLGEDAAVAFLLARSGDESSGAAKAPGKLVGELGGLPLALEQAAYIQATGRGVASYLSLFRERRAVLLSRDDPGGYGKQVATSWSLAFTRLCIHVRQAADSDRAGTVQTPKPVRYRGR